MNRPVLCALPAILLLSLPLHVARAAHFPDPVPTLQVMTLSASVTVDGSALAAGDEVAAYSVHPAPDAPGKWERTLVGRHVAGAGELTISMPVFGDDATTMDVVEGAVPGEEIALVLWRAGEGKEYLAYRTPAGTPIAVTWSLGAVGPVDVDFTPGERIPLRNSAWNLFSYGVLQGYQVLGKPAPTASQLPGVAWDSVPTLGDSFPLQSIAGKYDRLLGNDGTGATFWNPTLPSISTLSYLAPGYGYWVKMKLSSQPLAWMTVPGALATGAESLALRTGWTLTGYWGNGRTYTDNSVAYDASGELLPLTAWEFAPLPSIGDIWTSVAGNYVRVTSFDGQGAHLWNPSLPQTRTLRYLGPGYGYWIKMSVPDILAYPPP